MYLGAVRAEVATATYDNFEVTQTLNRIRRKYSDAVGLSCWTSIVVNLNTVADWHVDKGNIGESAIIVVGNFNRGGNLVTTDGQKLQSVNVRNRVLVFDGKKEHMSEAFFGNEPVVWRASIVFYTARMYKGIKADKRSFLKECGFKFPTSAVVAMSPCRSGSGRC